MPLVAEWSASLLQTGGLFFLSAKYEILVAKRSTVQKNLDETVRGALENLERNFKGKRGEEK